MKTLIGIVVAVVLIGGVYWFTQNNAEAPADTDTQTDTNNGSNDDTSDDTPAVTTPKTVTIRITSTGFDPSAVTINKGDTVTYVNEDSVTHWPASAPHPTHTDYSAFDSKPDGIAAGASWSFTFDQTGRWPFHDHLFPSRFGSVTVQ